MKRNWYALCMLALLALLLAGAGFGVDACAGQMRRDVNDAYACTLLHDYSAARRAYQAAALRAKRQGPWLRLAVRRTLVDKVEETLFTLPHYVQPDNQADLAVETARALAQIDQMEASYWGVA